MAKRGVDVDHATLNGWVIEYGPLLAEEAQMHPDRNPAALAPT